MPGIPCARHWTHKKKKGFLGAGEDRQGEKTPGTITDEKGAPGLSWTKLLMKISWKYQEYWDIGRFGYWQVWILHFAGVLNRNLRANSTVLEIRV